MNRRKLELFGNEFVLVTRQEFKKLQSALRVANRIVGKLHDTLESSTPTEMKPKRKYKKRAKKIVESSIPDPAAIEATAVPGNESYDISFPEFEQIFGATRPKK